MTVAVDDGRHADSHGAGMVGVQVILSRRP